ncbi:E3 ubiquitin ligase RBR family [Phytophthora cactorum]|nr:E3 ubiquitin ligase RBR family [Phytophthora cactorum]
MLPAASTCERVAHLSDLYDSLRQLQSFSGEDERMRWRWRLHQLQRQYNLEQQDAHVASLLAAIENQISVLPIESDGRLSQMRASSTTAAVDELRLTVEDSDDQRDSDSETPLNEDPSRSWRRGVATMDDTRRGSWDRMTRFVRAASGTLWGRSLAPVFEIAAVHPLSRMSMSELDAALDSFQRAPESVSAEEEKERDLSWSLTAYRRQESNSLGNSVPSLLRSMASYLGLSMEETFLCQICYDYAPVNTSYALSECGHTFCETCLRNYLEFKIKEGQVYPKCFFEKSEDKVACKAEISVDNVQSLVSDEVWQKYNKFKFNKEHELARQCPYCDHSQICAGSDHPECVCETCSREFCFVHSSAHQGRTCAEYDKKMIAVEKLNNALISKISKPCPGCQNNVEKTGGCHRDTVFPEHFQWWNVRGCAGNQMADIEGQGSTQKGIGMVMRILFFVVFANARLTFRQAFTTCFCVSGYILLAPIVLVLGLAALGVFIGGSAAGAAVLVCISPIVGMMLLFDGKPGARHPVINDLAHHAFRSLRPEERGNALATPLSAAARDFYSEKQSNVYTTAANASIQKDLTRHALELAAQDWFKERNMVAFTVAFDISASMLSLASKEREQESQVYPSGLAYVDMMEKTALRVGFNRAETFVSFPHTTTAKKWFFCVEKLKNADVDTHEKTEEEQALCLFARRYERRCVLQWLGKGNDCAKEIRERVEKEHVKTAWHIWRKYRRSIVDVESEATPAKKPKVMHAKARQSLELYPSDKIIGRALQVQFEEKAGKISLAFLLEHAAEVVDTLHTAYTEARKIELATK